MRCEYTQPAEQHPLPTPPFDALPEVLSEGRDADLDAALELRLLHHWTAHTSRTIAATWEFFQLQAPLIAMEHRYLMDVLLALAALHISRQPPGQWMPIEGRMVPASDVISRNFKPGHDSGRNWKLHLVKIDTYYEAAAAKAERSLHSHPGPAERANEMLNVSRRYWDRAIEGHRMALANLTIENAEAVYVASLLIQTIALFSMSEREPNESLDPLLWMRLARSVRYVADKWAQMAGGAWIASCGIFYGEPDMSDDQELFRWEHGKVFAFLLSWQAETEPLNEDDEETYRMVLSYIGLLYAGIVERTESHLVSSQRLLAMP